MIHPERNKMEIFEIKNLDCSRKESRKKLMKEFMKQFKLEEVPEKEKIGRISQKLEKKYGITLTLFLDRTNRKMQANLNINGTYSSFFVDSLLEAYMKQCLIIKKIVKEGKK